VTVYEKFIQPVRFKVLNTLDLEERLCEDGYVGTYHGSMDRFEEHLSTMGFRRNPLAWLKRREDDYADASWVKRKTLFSDRQLHVTLVKTHSNSKTSIYAHREDNWARHPVGHLLEHNVDCDAAMRLMRELLESHVPANRITYYVKNHP